MLERASLYPAGRCGACATFNAKEGSSIIIIADLGAQVLSTVNPDNDVRALEGHGVTPSNVRTVQRNSFIGNSLLERQLLTIVPDAALGETGERVIWKGLWRHYSTLHRKEKIVQSLSLGHCFHRPSLPPFGVRIDAMEGASCQRWNISSHRRGSISVIP